jgi:alkyl hydroperoxide reductase subunit AhpC
MRVADEPPPTDNFSSTSKVEFLWLADKRMSTSRFYDLLLHDSVAAVREF